MHQIKGPEPGFRMSRLMCEATNRLRRLPLVSVSLIQVFLLSSVMYPQTMWVCCEETPL